MSSTETLIGLLTRLSEARDPAILWGGTARPHFGPIFDRLLRCGVLEERAPAVCWPVCPDCDCGVDARSLHEEPGGWRAACPQDGAQDEVLDDDDIRSFTVDHAALVRELATLARLSDQPSRIVKGLWRLGVTDRGRDVFIAFSRSVAATDATVSIIRHAARSTAATLIAPRMPASARLALSNAGIAFTPIWEAFEPAPTPLGVAIRPATLDPASPQPALRFDAGTGLIRVWHVEATLSHQVSRVMGMLCLAASRGDGTVAAQAIDAATMRTAADVIRDLRQALVRAGLSDIESKQLVTTVPGRGYRLGLPASDVTLEP